MKSFTYTITDPVGIHARPAGLLVKAAREFAGTQITVTKGEKSAGAGQLMRLMGLGIKGGDQVTVTAQGPREEEALAAMEEFFRTHL